ncbi:hypothetical protein PQX77_006935 [Marasmius sp. AFHP31]|nr:hypothetical protein PQX77_006935 [Marasmius sp. AFHP31]
MEILQESNENRMESIGIDTPFAHVLDTNYAPSIVEQSMLRHLIQSPEGELRKIDEEISRLQARRHALKHFVDLHCALLSPFRRIPVDAWRLIFIECLPQSPLGLCFRTTRIAPLLLTMVCRSWREIALSTPKLWNSLHIFVPAPSPTFPDLSMFRERIEGVKRWLDRSGSLPLTISLAAGLHDPVVPRARLGRSFNVSISPDIRSLQTELMRLIARYSRRWKIIALGPNVRLTLDIHPFAMVADNLPCLESFYSSGNLFWEMRAPVAAVTDGGSETGPSTEQATLVGLLTRAPGLRRLQLSHETISKASLSLPVAWHNLIELSLLYPSSYSLEPGQHTAHGYYWQDPQYLKPTAYMVQRPEPTGGILLSLFRADLGPRSGIPSHEFSPLPDISEDNNQDGGDDGDDSYSDHGFSGGDGGRPAFFDIQKLAFEELLHRSQCAGGITHFELSAPHLFAVETVLRALRLMGKLELLDFGFTNLAKGGTRGSQFGPPEPFRATRWQRGWSSHFFRELSSEKVCPDLKHLSAIGCTVDDAIPILDLAREKGSLRAIRLEFGLVSWHIIQAFKSSAKIQEDMRMMREERGMVLDWRWKEDHRFPPKPMPEDPAADSTESSGIPRGPSTPPTRKRSLVEIALEDPAHISRTPRKGDSTLYTDFTKVHFEDVRSITLDAMGPTIHQYKVSDFLDRAVPEVPQDVVENTHQNLKKMKLDGKTDTVIAPNGRWVWFKDATPSKSDGSNVDEVFKAFEYISEAILKAAETTWSEKGKPKARFRCRPREVSNSDTENSGHKTDADQELEEWTNPAAKKFESWDSVTNAEFKKANTVENSNECVRQLLGNASDMMFSDPSRRFRFGLTILDASTRLWFFSRATSFVSEPFDFIKDPKPLIHFILATSFASKDEMGYDLTVERVQDDTKKWVYDYEVVGDDGQSTWYRTVKRLWTHQSGRITGCGIRVWEVRELDEGRKPVMQEGKLKPTCVLKDYWLTYDAVRESVRRNEIIDSAHAKRGGARRDIEKYFMTILHDTYVKCRNGEGELVSDTAEAHLRGWPLPDEHSEFLLETPPKSGATKPQMRNGVNSQATGTSDSVSSSRESSRHDRPETSHNPSGTVPLKRVCEPRCHCRTVFKEVGVRLDDLTDQRVLVQCLIDALEGLKVFYDGEYIHRDLSVGNLLWCYDSEHDMMVCKITDLEYARKYLQTWENDVYLHDHKIGTPAFMAVEVQMNFYMFQPRRGRSNLAQTTSETPFLHNYLHDIEGIWWILTHNLYTTVPTNPKEKASEGQRQQCINTANSIFPPSVGGGRERNLFVRYEYYWGECKRVLPSEYQDLADVSGEALDALLRYYRSVEDPTQRVLAHENYRGVYDEMIQYFERMKDHAVHSTESLDPSDQVSRTTKPKTQQAKRKRSSCDRDDDSYEPPSSKKARTNPPPPPQRTRTRRMTTSNVPATPMEEDEEGY